jgi:nanoRNase/pAp phosphatase (c-di-AMP/oligoRNAs hydrolase)
VLHSSCTPRTRYIIDHHPLYSRKFVYIDSGSVAAVNVVSMYVQRFSVLEVG